MPPVWLYQSAYYVRSYFPCYCPLTVWYTRRHYYSAVRVVWTLSFPGIGRPPEVNSRSQKLKATVCLAEEFPLDLQEQVMPIIDLMVRVRCTDFNAVERPLDISNNKQECICLFQELPLNTIRCFLIYLTDKTTCIWNILWAAVCTDYSILMSVCIEWTLEIVTSIMAS